MSDIMRRIITRFEAQPGNVRAVLGGMSSGYEKTAQSARVLGREQNYLNNQLRAFGTTMRYAIAGTAVFGAAGTISTLSEIQKQLGLISAIGSVSSPQGQGLMLVGDRLTKVSQQARQASINTVQPISAMNDAIVSLLSTVRNVPQDQLVPMVSEIARAATLSQISVDDATKSFTAMQTAFGKPINLSNVHKTAQEFFMMISRVPGGPAAGGQVIQQFGQLAAVARGGQISEPQLFALLTAGLRTGIPPSQYGRGLQYMIQTVTRQRTLPKDAAAAMDKLGVTPSFVQQHGGISALGRVIDAVKKAGGVGPNIRGQIRTLSTLEEQVGEEGAIPKALLTGPGAQVASNIFRRVHEYRTFLALYARATQAKGGLADPQLSQEIRDFLDAENGHVQQIEDLGQAWKRFSDQAKLPQAAIALQALGQDVATAFAPILNLAAKGITGAAGAATKHQDVTAAVAYGVGLAALAYGGVKFTRGMLGRGAPALALAQGLHGAEGQWKGIPGESVTHPAYVWVLGTGMRFGAGAGTPVGGPMGVPGEGGTPRPGWRGGVQRFGGGALRAAGIAGLVYTGMELTDPLFDKIPHWRKSPEEKAIANKSILLGQAGAAKYFYDPMKKRFSLVQDGADLTIKEKWAAKALGKTPADIERMIHPQKVVGKAHVQMDITTKNPDGRTTGRKKTGVTMDLYPLFNDAPQKAPSSRGQSRTSRG